MDQPGEVSLRQSVTDFLQNYRSEQQQSESAAESGVVLRNRNENSLFANHKLTLKEVEGEVFDWLSHHLELKRCPYSLSQVLALKISKNLSDSLTQQHQPTLTNDDGTVNHRIVLVPSTELYQRSLAELSELINDLKQDQDKAIALASEYTYRPFIFSLDAIKNNRKKMEDRHVVIHDLNKVLGLNLSKQYSYYAIFDGHAGADAASYTSSHLHKHLVKSQAFIDGDVVGAFREAFNLTDFDYLTRSAREGVATGSTALCALLENNKKLYIVWLGDSQALLVKNGNIFEITDPHKPDRPDEKARIEDSGGIVTWYDTWRVNGTLAVSRAIGDPEHKPHVISVPEVKEIDFDGTEDFLVLGCDGLWDQLTPEEVSTLVYQYLCESGQEDPVKAAESVASFLSQKAKAEGSFDNITTIVLFFKDLKDLMACEYTPFKSKNNSNGSVIQNDQQNGFQNSAFEFNLSQCDFSHQSSVEQSSGFTGDLPTPPIDEILNQGKILSFVDDKSEESASDSNPSPNPFFDNSQSPNAFQPTVSGNEFKADDKISSDSLFNYQSDEQARMSQLTSDHEMFHSSNVVTHSDIDFTSGSAPDFSTSFPPSNFVREQDFCSTPLQPLSTFQQPEKELFDVQQNQVQSGAAVIDENINSLIEDQMASPDQIQSELELSEPEKFQDKTPKDEKSVGGDLMACEFTSFDSQNNPNGSIAQNGQQNEFQEATSFNFSQCDFSEQSLVELNPGFNGELLPQRIDDVNQGKMMGDVDNKSEDSASDFNLSSNPFIDNSQSPNAFQPSGGTNGFKNNEKVSSELFNNYPEEIGQTSQDITDQETLLFSNVEKHSEINATSGSAPDFSTSILPSNFVQLEQEFCSTPLQSFSTFQPPAFNPESKPVMDESVNEELYITCVSEQAHKYSDAPETVWQIMENDHGKEKDVQPFDLQQNKVQTDIAAIDSKINSLFEDQLTSPNQIQSELLKALEPEKTEKSSQDKTPKKEESVKKAIVRKPTPGPTKTKPETTKSALTAKPSPTNQIKPKTGVEKKTEAISKTTTTRLLASKPAVASKINEKSTASKPLSSSNLRSVPSKPTTKTSEVKPIATGTRPAISARTTINRATLGSTTSTTTVKPTTTRTTATRTLTSTRTTSSATTATRLASKPAVAAKVNEKPTATKPLSSSNLRSVPLKLTTKTSEVKPIATGTRPVTSARIATTRTTPSSTTLTATAKPTTTKPTTTRTITRTSTSTKTTSSTTATRLTTSKPAVVTKVNGNPTASKVSTKS